MTYPLHDREVVITACGRICMHRKRINVSLFLAGQRVGIEELDEAIWIVTFVHYDLGFVTVSVPVERGQCCEGAAKVRPEPANGGPPARTLQAMPDSWPPRHAAPTLVYGRL